MEATGVNARRQAVRAPFFESPDGARPDAAMRPLAEVFHLDRTGAAGHLPARPAAGAPTSPGARGRGDGHPGPSATSEGTARPVHREGRQGGTTPSALPVAPPRAPYDRSFRAAVPVM